MATLHMEDIMELAHWEDITSVFSAVKLTRWMQNIFNLIA